MLPSTIFLSGQHEFCLPAKLACGTIIWKSPLSLRRRARSRLRAASALSGAISEHQRIYRWVQPLLWSHKGNALPLAERSAALQTAPAWPHDQPDQILHSDSQRAAPRPRSARSSADVFARNSYITQHFDCARPFLVPPGIDASGRRPCRVNAKIHTDWAIGLHRRCQDRGKGVRCESCYPSAIRWL